MEALFTALTERIKDEVEVTLNSFLTSRPDFNGDIVILYSKYEDLTDDTLTYFRTKYKAIFEQIDHTELEVLYSKLKTELIPNPKIYPYLAIETFSAIRYDKIYWCSPNIVFMQPSLNLEKQGDAIFFKRDSTLREDKKIVLQPTLTQVNPNFFILTKPAIGRNYHSFVYRNLFFNKDMTTALTYFLVNYLSSKCVVKILENNKFPMVENFVNQNFNLFLAQQSLFVGVDFNFVHNVNQKNYIKILDVLKTTKLSWTTELEPRLLAYTPNQLKSVINIQATLNSDVPTNLKFNELGQSQKLCIIVPYRNRSSHLEQFIPYMTEYLENVNNITDYKICIVEQDDNQAFNRAKLLNIGFLENPNFDYYCFHDVDMLPEKADYSYSAEPIHMATACSQFNYKLPYPEYYGGVTMIPHDVFVRVNGFSNDYWGWGAEDDDFYSRLLGANFKPGRREGRFKSLPHSRDLVHQSKNENWNKLVKQKEKPLYEKIKNGFTTSKYTITDRSGYGKIKFIKVTL